MQWLNVLLFLIEVSNSDRCLQ